MNRALFAIAGLIYWVVALWFAFLSTFAPCGLAPDESCDIEGPSTIGAVLGALGPLGTFAVFVAMFGAINWLIQRNSEVR